MLLKKRLTTYCLLPNNPPLYFRGFLKFGNPPKNDPPPPNVPSWFTYAYDHAMYSSCHFINKGSELSSQLSVNIHICCSKKRSCRPCNCFILVQLTFLGGIYNTIGGGGEYNNVMIRGAWYIPKTPLRWWP